MNWSALEIISPILSTGYTGLAISTRMEFRRQNKTRYIIVCIISFLLCCTDFYQSVQAQGEKFFPAKNLMLSGVYYFPKGVSEVQRTKDIQRIAELGFDMVLLGAGGWDELEPQPGMFDFAWLDKCIDESSGQKLKIILAIPSLIPPDWLLRQHPELVAFGPDSVPERIGKKLAVNPGNAIYRYYVKRLTGQMASRYGHDRRISGWLIDNDLRPGTRMDYSENALSGFQHFLSQRYHRISVLNEAWGIHDADERYHGFDQVPLPVCDSMKHFFSINHDFLYYTAEAHKTFIDYQADSLKKNIAGSQFVTSAYASLEDIGPFTSLLCNDGKLDFQSHDAWPLHPTSSTGPISLTETGLRFSLNAELANSYAGYSGIADLLSGIPGPDETRQELPSGPVRLVSWHAFALGERYISLFPFRIPEDDSQFRKCGIMEKEGTSFNPGDEIFVQAVRETRELRRYFKPEFHSPAGYDNRKAAVLWDTWHLDAFLKDYQILKGMGSKVRFLVDEASISALETPFLIAGMDMACRKEWSAKLEIYVRQGGTLILVATKPTSDSLFGTGGEENKRRLEELCGMHWSSADSLNSMEPLEVKIDTSNYVCTHGSSVIKGIQGSKTWYSYSLEGGQYPAVVQQRKGKGSIIAVGCNISDPSFEKILLSKIWTTGGATILQLPLGVFVEWRNGFWVAVNYSPEPFKMNMGRNAKILMGQQIISPGEVCVWIEE